MCLMNHERDACIKLIHWRRRCIGQRREVTSYVYVKTFTPPQAIHSASLPQVTSCWCVGFSDTAQVLHSASETGWASRPSIWPESLDRIERLKEF